MLQCQESAHYSKFLPSKEWQINLFVECASGCEEGGDVRRDMVRVDNVNFSLFIANAISVVISGSLKTGKCHFQKMQLMDGDASVCLIFCLKFVFFYSL